MKERLAGYYEWNQMNVSIEKSVGMIGAKKGIHHISLKIKTDHKIYNTIRHGQALLFMRKILTNKRWVETLSIRGVAKTISDYQNT